MADMSLTADHQKEATNNNASCQPRVKWCDKLDKTTFIITLLGQFEMDREVTLSLPPNVFPGQNTQLYKEMGNSSQIYKPTN